MATPDDDTTPPPAAPPPSAGDPIIQGLLAQATQDPMAAYRQYQQSMADQTPVHRSVTSLLGSVLGGGPGPMNLSPAQQEMEGNRALLNFGLNMLMNSGPSPVRHGLGQIVASGLQGAGEATSSYEQQINALQQQQFKNAGELQNMQLERLKAVLPLLRMQQGANMPNLLLGGNAPGSSGAVAATGAPIGGSTYEGAIAGHEGLTADSRLPSTVGGFRPDTWQGFVAANPTLFAGMTPEQILAARSDPKLNASGITWLAQQNADQLTKAGVTPSGTSLGIAHYLGATPAAKVMGAPDNAPVSSFVSDAAVKANPELATMTVGQLKQRYANVPNPGFLAPPGATRTATAPPAPTTPAPVTRPTVVPAAPAGTIQGAPDTGGAQFAGPGALPGKIAPPGPAVPGDVKAIIGGMTGAGASPTTLAPGTATAGPIAPPVSTVVASNAPAPQQPTQADQPPPPGEMTIEQYRAQHPITLDPATYTVPQPDLSALVRAQSAAAQQLDMARRGLGGDPNKSLSDYNTATKAITDAQQAAAAKSLELQQAARKDAEDRLQQAYDAEMTRRQQAQLKAQELAQQAAENEKQRQSQVELEHIKAGSLETAAQKKADIDIAQSDLTERAADAQKSARIIPVLQQIGSQQGNLPGGLIGTLLAKYDTTGDLTGMLAKMGIVDPSKATAAQLLIAARNFLSIETKPAATGSLRVAEMDKLQSYTPGMLDTDQAKQEMISRLIAYQQRIQDERDFAGNYFGRTDPKTGQRIYDNRGLDKAMNAPVQYDQNGVVTGGGLGPVVPEPPSVNAPDAEHQAYLNYIRRNVKPGMPYQTYAPQTDANGNIVRDTNGRTMPQRVTKVKGYD